MFLPERTCSKQRGGRGDGARWEAEGIFLKKESRKAMSQSHKARGFFCFQTKQLLAAAELRGTSRWRTVDHRADVSSEGRRVGAWLWDAWLGKSKSCKRGDGKHIGDSCVEKTFVELLTFSWFESSSKQN